jgi:hypothetical protein
MEARKNEKTAEDGIAIASEWHVMSRVGKDA